MNSIFKYLSVAIFSIFVGSQITEGALLVPYWQSLSADEFYTYYQKFGPSIISFYSILTIVAALIPIGYSVYFYRKKSSNLRWALLSTLFAVLFLLCFYIYFKGANELFFQSTLDEESLKNELVIWSKWHWGRVVLEILSLLFLIFAFQKKR